MQYAQITYQGIANEALEDLFLQGLADLGCDSFMDSVAYLPAVQLDERALKDYVETFNLTYGTQVSYLTALCPDENWNEVWEAEHPVQELPMGVRIVPHCAFGAGHHETTGMMVDALVESGRRDGEQVLDMGCGTGVLGIFAAKQGAQVLAVDIDDKSVENTKENALLNGVELTAQEGGTVPDGAYHLVLANIHRNILLGMMPDFQRVLRPQGEVWMSGFLEEDVEVLARAARAVGLEVRRVVERNEWRMMQLIKQ